MTCQQISCVIPASNALTRAAREELAAILEDDALRGVPVLIFANKQDLPKAVEPRVVAEKLEMTKMRDRAWHVQGCNATTGDGVYEGLDWMADAVKRK